MRFEFVGQSVKDDDFPGNATGRLLNWYRAPTEEGMVLRSVLGTEAFADLSVVFMRDMIEDGGYIYAVAGGSLFQVDTNGTTTTLDSLADGDTVLSSNNGKITIAADGTYYVYDGSAISTPTGGRFTDVGSVEFLGEYTIRTENNGREFDWSELTDPETLNGLYFATAEKRDDNILRAVAINGRLVLFGEESREVWFVTGQSGANAFRHQGVVDTGLKSKKLVTKIKAGAFFVGNDDIAYVTDGLSETPVSTGAVSTAIAQGSPERCFYFEDEGHKFAVIQFSDRPAWVYDLTTREWHERQEDGGAWMARVSVKLGNNWFVGTDLGAIYKLTRNNADVAAALVRRAVSRTLRQEKRFRVYDIEVYPSVGFSDLGRDAECWLRSSNDGGITWGAEQWKSLGDLGDYAKRVCWKGSQGMFDRFTMDLNISDPVDISFRADLEARVV